MKRFLLESECFLHCGESDGWFDENTAVEEIIKILQFEPSWRRDLTDKELADISVERLDQDTFYGPNEQRLSVLDEKGEWRVIGIYSVKIS